MRLGESNNHYWYFLTLVNVFQAIAQELSVKHELAVPESSCQLEDVSVDEGGKNSIAMTVNDGLSLDLDNEDELQVLHFCKT